MAKLGVVAAARAAGVSRVTIRRYIATGKLSCVLDRKGRRQIDTAELLRVFGDLSPPDRSQTGTPEGTEGTKDVTSEVTLGTVSPAPAPDTAALLAELRNRIDQLEHDRAELRRDLDAERAKVTTWTERYHELSKRLLLTDQRTPTSTPRPRRSPSSTTRPTPAPTLADVVTSWFRGR